jgi:Icc-related predicted phosphoesterase
VRLLGFSDLHRSRRHARVLVELAEQADVVVGAGDFTSLRLGLGGVLDSLSAITRPFVLVPGNNETDAGLWRASAGIEQATVLHGEGRRIEGVDFYGLGGAIPPSPTPWSWNVSEAEAARLLAACPRGGVLVVHSPPHGYVDQAFGKHLGSHAVLNAIERCQPALTLCGHVHQCQGQEAMIGDTRVINLGPSGTLIEL